MTTMTTITTKTTTTMKTREEGGGIIPTTLLKLLALPHGLHLDKEIISTASAPYVLRGEVIRLFYLYVRV